MKLLMLLILLTLTSCVTLSGSTEETDNQLRNARMHDRN